MAGRSMSDRDKRNKNTSKPKSRERSLREKFDDMPEGLRGSVRKAFKDRPDSPEGMAISDSDKRRNPIIRDSEGEETGRFVT